MTEPQMEKARPPIDAAAFTRMLRVSGGVLLIASASTFMLQQWDRGNDLARYALLVGHSVLIAIAAWFCGLRVNESRGARTFLAILLLIVPTTFAVLGGLVYSQFHWETIPALPSYARWVAPSEASALLAALGTLVVLVPLMAIAFVALARKEAKALTLAFLAQNLLLLVPVRGPNLIVLLFGVAIAGLTELELRRFSKVAQLSTLEGRLARASLFVAPAILVGRAVHLYHPTALFVGGVLLTAAYVVFAATKRVIDAATRDAAALACAALGVVGWGFCYAEVYRHVSAGAAHIVLAGLPSALIVLVASRRAVQLRGLLSGLGGAAALVTAVTAPLVELSTWAALACIVTGVMVLAWGAARHSFLHAAAGGLVGIIGVGLQVALAVRENEFMRWGSLLIGGIALVVGASLADRHKGQLSEWFRGSAS